MKRKAVLSLEKGKRGEKREPHNLALKEWGGGGRKKRGGVSTNPGGKKRIWAKKGRMAKGK